MMQQIEHEKNAVPKSNKRVVKNGISTNDLIFSAYIENNEEVFPKVLELYVAKGCLVADITYGQGVFWRKIPQGSYNLLATDLKDGVDSRICLMRMANLIV